MLHIQFVVKLNGSSLSTQYVPLQRKFKLLALLAVCSFSQILALVGHCKIYLSGKVKLKYYFIRKLFCWLLARDTEVSTTGPPDYRAASFLRQSDAWTHPQHSIIKARQSSHCFNKFYLVYLILTKSKKTICCGFTGMLCTFRQSSTAVSSSFLQVVSIFSYSLLHIPWNKHKSILV